VNLWTKAQDDPVFMRRTNGWFTIFWLVMLPISFVTGLVNSVAFVSGISLWALVAAHWGAWQSARVEVKQLDEAERMTEQLVEHTNIESTDPKGT
jgi:hypothetical protein